MVGDDAGRGDMGMHRAGSLEQELAAAKHMVATLSMDLTDMQRDLHAVTKAKVRRSFLDCHAGPVANSLWLLRCPRATWRTCTRRR